MSLVAEVLIADNAAATANGRANFVHQGLAHLLHRVQQLLGRVGDRVQKLFAGEVVRPAIVAAHVRFQPASDEAAVALVLRIIGQGVDHGLADGIERDAVDAVGVTDDGAGGRAALLLLRLMLPPGAGL